MMIFLAERGSGSASVPLPADPLDLAKL